MKIPIQNIYYLLCYAWNSLEEAEVIDVRLEPSAPLVDLFACVLVRGVEHLLKRGLAREYRVVEDAIPGVRGRIVFSETLNRQLLPSAKTWCQFDELAFDGLPNQIVKTSLHQYDFILRYKMHGRSVQVRSVNLAQPWRGIREELLSLAAT